MNLIDNTDEKTYILVIFAIDDINDDEELFLDYWELYEIDKDDHANWLLVPESPLNIYFTKRCL